MVSVQVWCELFYFCILRNTAIRKSTVCPVEFFPPKKSVYLFLTWTFLSVGVMEEEKCGCCTFDLNSPQHPPIGVPLTRSRKVIRVHDEDEVTWGCLLVVMTT